jgi:hypothetical protein
MTATCPQCGHPLEVSFTHTGVSSDGLYQRGFIEATHSAPACEVWRNSEQDLLSLAPE